MDNTHAKKPALLLLACLVILPQIGETIYTPGLAALARDINVDQGLAQSTLSVFFAGFALGVLAWGRISDRIGRRQALLHALIVYTVGCVICLAASGIGPLLAGRFVQAFGAAACSVVVQAICREAFAGKERMHVFTTISMLIPFSTAIGPFIGGWSAQWFDWRASFVILLCLGVGLLAASWKSLPETATRTTDAIKAPSISSVARRMSRDSRILGMALLVGISNGVIFSFYAEAPFLMIEGRGLSSGGYGTLCMVIVTGSIAGGATVRMLSGSGWRTEGMLVLGLALMAIAALGLVAASPLLADSRSEAGLWLFGLLSAMLFAGITVTTTTCLHGALERYHDALGTAGALFGLAYYLIVAGLTEGMAILHNGAPVTFPLYALAMIAVAGVGYAWLIVPALTDAAQEN